MGTRTIAVLVTIAFSVISVLGDYFLKVASAREQPLRTGWFYIGFALYASTAFGWVFVMKHLKLATISVLYSVSLVLLLTGFSIAATTRWWSAMIIGALYGFAFGLVIYLAKGGPKSGDAPYVIPSGIITAALTGLFIVMWAIKTS